MYTKKILSAAAAVAVMSMGAMAFDYTLDGEIVADITTATQDATPRVISKFASYVGGVAADENLTLSANSKGDALIYPAFKAGGDGAWSSDIAVRNAENNATVCKVVLYAADNSRELLDFDIYLSPYDVFRFNIDENGDVSTSDGSFALVDPTLRTDQHQFLTHNEKTQKIGNITSRPGNEDVTSGYAIIYAMVEATNKRPNDTSETAGKSAVSKDGKGAYHGKHSELFEDFRKVVDICRDVDRNVSTTASWRTVLGSNSASIQNGTATDTNVTAPTVASNCIQTMIDDGNATGETNDTVVSLISDFTSPSSDLLFGDIRISSSTGEKRDLLIPATALDNYTAANQMMLWVPGEYAAIQDRRMASDGAVVNCAKSGCAANTRTGFSDYNITAIQYDAKTFEVGKAYYTFDANEMKGANTLLLTQPMKRALMMADNIGGYWIAGKTGIAPISNKWGEFQTISSYYNENENLDEAATTLTVVTSPVSGDAADAYHNELQKINDPERTETSSEMFKASKEAGFAIMNLGGGNLPAIVTQMTGSVVDGEAQINWVYSTTDK